jgi:hypothetical protein
VDQPPSVDYHTPPIGARRKRPDVGLTIVASLCGVVAGAVVIELSGGVGGRIAMALADHTAMRGNAFVEGIGQSLFALSALAVCAYAGCVLTRRWTKKWDR